MYSLQAFPTQKVLKDFTPYRGIILSSEVVLSHAEIIALHQAEFGSLENSQLIQNAPVASILIDTTPVLELIAKEWNYDLNLLKEGKGETGQLNHSWTMYSDNKISPVIVRWSLGKARLHIVMGNNREDFKFNAIGNYEAKDVLERLTVILGSLHERTDCVEEIDVTIGDTVQKVHTGKYSGSTDFSTHCVVVKPDTGVLSEARRRDCLQLANSCNLVMYSEAESRNLNTGLKANEMMLNVLNLPRGLKYEAQVGCSWEVLDIIYAKSLRNAGRQMNRLISKAINPARAARMEAERKIDGLPQIEDSDTIERKKYLFDQCKDLIDYAEKGHSLTNSPRCDWKKITLSYDFQKPEASVLKGTRIEKIMRGGDVCLGYDLIELMIGTLLNLSNHIPSPKPKKEKDIKPRIRGRVEGVNLPEEPRKEFDVKLETISNPYFSVHMGMPVRVDQSVSVWRDGDTEALACDVWYDVESRHLHAANLYRIKVPQS